MNDGQKLALAALDALLYSTGVLVGHLSESNLDGAQEANAVILLQLYTFFGPDSIPAQQLLPAMSAIEADIISGEVASALARARSLEGSLREILQFLRAGQGL